MKNFLHSMCQQINKSLFTPAYCAVDDCGVGAPRCALESEGWLLSQGGTA